MLHWRSSRILILVEETKRNNVQRKVFSQRGLGAMMLLLDETLS